MERVGFNVVLDTLQVMLEMIFPTSHLAGTTVNKLNKAFIDITFRPSITTPLTVVGWGWAVHASLYGTLRPNMTSSIKPEVHNISQRRHSRIQPRPQGIHTTNFVKLGKAVPEICSRTDRHTHRQTNLSQ